MNLPINPKNHRLSFNLNGRRALIYIFIALFFTVAILSATFFSMPEWQQYSLLARSFVHGKLYLTEYHVFGQKLPELTYWQGHYYVAHGPFPAVLLIPFVYAFEKFHIFFYQNYLSSALVICVFITCFLLYKKLKYRKEDVLYLAFAFCFGTMFLGVSIRNTTPGYLGHILTVFLISLSLLEYCGKKRFWLIGSFVGLAALTRLTAGGGILFFILAVLFLENKTKRHINLMRLLVPFSFLIIMLGAYNYARFADVLEEGYSQQQISNDSLNAAKDYGLVNIKHLPGNLYYAFISGPVPVFKDGVSHVLTYPFVQANPWGMSIFFTSPCLLYLFFLKYKDKTSLFLITTCVFIAVPVFLFFGLGYRQFGYRYCLDFLPFLFFLFAKNYREQYGKLSANLKTLILISACVNLYLWINFLHYLPDIK
jgi:hypothetical protein